MILTAIITSLAAGAIALAQQAGQSIQQWISSPAGQQFLQNAAQQLGQEGLQQLLKKLGLD